MPYQKADYTDEILRKKMREWGIPLDQKSVYHPSPIISATVKADFVDYLLRDWFSVLASHESVDVENKVKTLESTCKKHEQRIRELELALGTRRELTKADQVYMKYKDHLEKEHFGKIVAIDVESERIVGIGDTILEAYKRGKDESTKNRFSYKRVGYGSVYKLV